MICPDLCQFVIFKYVRKKAKKVNRLLCFSSNVNDVITAVLNFFYSFYKKNNKVLASYV